MMPGSGISIADGRWHKLTVTTGAAAVAFASNPVMCLQALLQNDSDTAITFGPDSAGDFFTLSPSAGYSLSVPGKQFDLATFYAHAGGAAKVLSVLYCD